MNSMTCSWISDVFSDPSIPMRVITSSQFETMMSEKAISKSISKNMLYGLMLYLQFQTRTKRYTTYFKLSYQSIAQAWANI